MGRTVAPLPGIFQFDHVYPRVFSDLTPAYAEMKVHGNAELGTIVGLPGWASCVSDQTARVRRQSRWSPTHRTTAAPDCEERRTRG